MICVSESGAPEEGQGGRKREGLFFPERATLRRSRIMSDRMESVHVCVCWRSECWLLPSAKTRTRTRTRTRAESLTKETSPVFAGVWETVARNELHDALERVPPTPNDSADV